MLVSSSFNDRKLERNDVITSKSDLGHEFTELTNFYLFVILRCPNLSHNLFHLSFLQFGMTCFQRFCHQLNNFVILQINPQLLRQLLSDILCADETRMDGARRGVDIAFDRELSV